MLTLLASGIRTASGNSGGLGKPLHPEMIRRARFILDVTAAATDANDTLDVYIQTKVDGAWDDLAHFTQVLGNGGAKNFIAEWNGDVVPESEQHARSDGALAVGVLQGAKLGTDFLAKWVIADPGGGAASFTFSVSAEFLYYGR